MSLSYLLRIFFIKLNSNLLYALIFAFINVNSFAQTLEVIDKNALTGDSNVFGLVYRDVNNNGSFDSNIDVRLSNIDVIVSSSTFTISVDTDSQGQWIVENLPQGIINVSVDLSDIEACFDQTEGDDIQIIDIAENSSNNAGNRGYFFELPEASCKDEIDVVLSESNGVFEAQISVLELINNLNYCPKYVSYEARYTSNSGVLQTAFITDNNDDSVINQEDLTTASYILFNCDDIGNVQIEVVKSLNTKHINSSVVCQVEARVIDLIGPEVTISELNDINVQCPIENQNHLFELLSELNIERPTATDNCDQEVFGEPNVEFPIDSNSIIEWTFTDLSGNTSTTTLNQLVTVQDTEAPVPNESSLTPIETSCEINTIVDLAQLFPNGSLPTATDNCDGQVPGVLEDNSIFPITSNTQIKWVFTDSSGNTSSNVQTQFIEINDTEPPVAVCKNIEVTLNDNGEYILNAVDLDNGSTDNCQIDTFLVNGLDQITFNCNQVGANNLSFEVSDGSENSANSFCEVIVTVIDNTTPEPSQDNSYTPITSDCPITDFNDLVALMSEKGISLPTAIDNCSNVVTASIDASYFPVSDNVVIPWQFFDEYGNRTITDPIQVININAPDSINLICVEQLSVSLDDVTGSVVLNGEDLIDFDAMNQEDLCHVEQYVLDGVDLFDCTDVNTTQAVSVLALDFEGEQLSQCSVDVTILDQISPTAICKDLTIELNQDGIVEITPEMVDNGSFDNCEIVSMQLSESQFNATGQYQVQLTVVDSSGNSDSCELNVVVEKNSDYLLSGHLYYDVNGNGKQDEGEPNLINRKVSVKNHSGNVLTEMTTNAIGDWSYLAEVSGQLVVEIDTLGIENYIITQGENPSSVDAQKGSQDHLIIGFHDNITQPGNLISLEGHVYFDSNGNGNQENNEPDASNRLVFFNNVNEVELSVKTSLDGNWKVTGLQKGQSTTIKIDDSDLQGYSVTQGVNPNSLNLLPNFDYSNQEDFNLIVGFYNSNHTSENIEASGHVYFDLNGNGTQDEGEPNAIGRSLVSTSDVGIQKHIRTDNFGNWVLTGLSSGLTNFNISQIGIEDHVATEGNNPWQDQLNINGIYRYNVGFNDPDFNPSDFITVSGKVYKDVDGDGNQQSTEPNIIDQLVLIKDSNGIESSVVTNENGIWLINGLTEGHTEFQISEDNLEGFIITQGENPLNLNLDTDNDYIINDSFRLIVGYNDPEISSVGILSGHIYIDKDCSGNQEIGDPDLPAGIPVIVIDSTGNPSIVYTDENGDWSVSTASGAVSSEVVINNSSYSLVNYTLNDTSSNPSVTNVLQNETTLADPIGFCPNDIELSSLSGFMYYDDNANGVFDSCEEPIVDYSFIVSDVLSDYEIKTDFNGNWSINVESGDVIIDYSLDSHFSNYLLTQGISPEIIAANPNDAITVNSIGVFLKSRAPYTITGRIYEDSNTNGVQDSDENAISDQPVELEVNLLNGFSYTENTTTNTDGNWSLKVPLGSVVSTIVFNDSLDESQLTQTQGTNPTTTFINEDHICSSNSFEQTPDGLFTGIKIFNALSPNDDGVNDFFELVGVENFPNNNMVITNRWGVKVYDVDNYGVNGKVFKGISEGRISFLKSKKLPKGTYYYFFKYEVNGKMKEIQGFLNIN